MRSLRLWTTLGAFALLAASVAIASSETPSPPTGVLVRAAAPAPDDRAPGRADRTPPAAQRMRLPVRGLRDGDLLLGVSRPWMKDAPYTPLVSFDAVRGLRLAREDCLPGRAPVLALRGTELVWLAGARDGWGTTVWVEQQPLPEDLPERLEQARSDPLAALTLSERRKRQGQATDDLEFGPLSGEPPVGATPESIPSLPPDPHSDGYAPCPGLSEDWSPRPGLRVHTYGEARALTFPEEDGTRALVAARAWHEAVAEALEGDGYERTEANYGREAGLTRVWSLCFTRSPRDDEATPLPPNVLRRTIEVGYLECGVAFRRYSDLVVDSADDRAILMECMPYLARVEWALSRRLRNLRVPIREHGEPLVRELAEAFEHQRAGQALTFGALVSVPSYDGWDPLWDEAEAADFHEAVEAAVKAACKQYRVPENMVSVGLCDPHTNEYGMFMGDTMRYAACVAKLLVILGVYEEEANGKLTITREMEAAMSRMIRLSSMPEAGELARKVGIKRILEIAQSPRYRLYDKERGGGMWHGRPFWGGGPMYRDPVANLSHAVTARQVLRYYWMLDHGLLVSPESSRRMEDVFQDDTVCGILDHKIVHALRMRGGMAFIRKSGWYPPQQNDTALITGPGRHYILCCFVRSGSGDQVIEAISKRLDDFMIARAHPERAVEADAGEPAKASPGTN